jgi:uncharacterized protein (TIGR03118 family)
MKAWTCTFVALGVAGAACGDSGGVATVSAPDNDRVVQQTDIVSDQSGALVTDPELINAWGLAFNPIGTAWVSAAGSGVSTIYDANGNTVLAPVTIPGGASGDDPSAPTGQVFNGDSNSFMGDLFIFVTEDGTISGWTPDDNANAELRVDNSSNDAVYKGVAIATDNDGTSRLYAADFHNAVIGVYDSSYAPAQIQGDFSDPDLPDGYAPFNIEETGGALIVAYALQDDEGEDDVKGAGNGYINMFDLRGNLLGRVASQGDLNSPWGLVLTPDGFSAAPNRLLVGNFGDGRILSYALDPNDSSAPATLEGALRDENGDDIVIDGLWALEFGIDAGGFASDQLYFTAGPGDEEHGIFGRLASSTATNGTAGGGAPPPPPPPPGGY